MCMESVRCSTVISSFAAYSLSPLMAISHPMYVRLIPTQENKNSAHVYKCTSVENFHSYFNTLEQVARGLSAINAMHPEI